jgi:hypothetical protein
MHVQYLVGLCCLRHTPEAVEVTLGDQIEDDATNSSRDVDVTVTIVTNDGHREAITGCEVKNEKRPLDVTDIEQLCAKMNDMPSLTERSIVSASGYYSNCQGKANKHGVVLYDLLPWESAVTKDFPKSNLHDTPANSLLFAQQELVWLDGVSVKVNPSDPRRELWIGLSDQQPILDAAGNPLGAGKDFQNLVRRTLSQAAAQLASSPQAQAAYMVPRTTPPHEQPDGPVGPPIQIENLNLIIGEPIFVSIGDALIRIQEVVVSGALQWFDTRQNGTFHMMRRHDDPTCVYAGAAVCEVPGHEGVLSTLLLSPVDTKLSIHFIYLSEKHKHMIRGLKLRSRPA